MCFYDTDQTLHVLRNRGDCLQRRFRDRVLDLQSTRMEHLAVSLVAPIHRKVSVHGVPDQRAIQGLQVDTDLVRSPSVQPHFDDGEALRRSRQRRREHAEF